MTPHSQQRILAAYAEVDLTKKVKKVKERPLSSSHSEEWLEGITAQSPSLSENTSRKTKHVISPYGTLPRQRSSSKQTGFPVYAQVDKKPNKKHNDDSASITESQSSEKDRSMHIYAEVQEVMKQEVMRQEAAAFSSDAGSHSESSDAEQQPQVPPQTKASLTLDQSSLTDEDSNFMIAAYATVDARTVDTSRKLTKEEIASKTQSLGRSLKPKSKPAPLPPQPKTQKIPVPLPKAQSMDDTPVGSDIEFAPLESTHRPWRDPVYETVGSPDSDGKVVLESSPSQSAELSQSAPTVTVNDSTFLFKNKKTFMPVGRRTSSNSMHSGQYSDDSEYDSTDWESGSEEELEVSEVS